jgi:hypothetical protein
MTVQRSMIGHATDLQLSIEPCSAAGRVNHLAQPPDQIDGSHATQLGHGLERGHIERYGVHMVTIGLDETLLSPAAQRRQLRLPVSHYVMQVEHKSVRYVDVGARLHTRQQIMRVHAQRMTQLHQSNHRTLTAAELVRGDRLDRDVRLQMVQQLLAGPTALGAQTSQFITQYTGEDGKTRIIDSDGHRVGLSQ